MNHQISERHARCLLVIKDSNKQKEYLNRIINDRLTVRDLGDIIKAENSDLDLQLSKMKSESQDIIVNQNISDNFSSNINFTTEPINIGAKPETRFFNSLESESANMQMTEALNPFVSPTYMAEIPSFTNDNEDATEQIVENNVQQDNTVDNEIEYLDFNIDSNSVPKDVFAETTEKIESLIDDIKNDFQVVYNKSSNNANEINYIIRVINDK